MRAEPPVTGGDGTAGDVLAGYLRGQATTFLRALTQGESDGGNGGAAGTADAAHQLRRSARRIGSALHTYGPLTDTAWSEPLRAELGWLASSLAREYQHSARLARLLSALHRLSSAEVEDEPALVPAQQSPPAPGGGPLAVGGARAGALLERQLTLARTRAHSAALQAMGSSRFHAVADAVAVLASEVSLTAAAEAPADKTLPALTERAHTRLAEAAGALPLARAGQPYNGDTLRAALAADLPAERQDAPWHRVRILLRLSRYAREVFPYDDGEPETRPAALARVLEQHREAAEAAEAVTAAARTPRIAPATAYALGVLHADQRQEVEQARFAFVRLWMRA
ncbi:CHAD domain-containing protein [Streptomyces sp. NBC_01537]